MKTIKYLLTLVILVPLFLSGCASATTPVLFGLLPKTDTVAVDQTGSLNNAPLAANVQDNNQESQVGQTGSLADLQETFISLYEKVNPSVVNIEVQVDRGGGTAFSQFSQGGLGSGFIWDTKGHIVTNNHVVENASRILVNFADGSTAEAKLVGTDPNSDLAVIKVDDVPADQLIPVSLVDSDQVKVGQIAIAIGNPFGLSGTMTEGIVSALSRSLPVSTTADGSSYTIPDIIQTDAAINPGNSGGVLVDLEGKVMGVTAAIRSSSDSNSGIGFVIPSNIVARVVPTLIENGKFTHTYMGISGVTLSLDLAEAMDLPSSQTGVVVIQVSENSPAEKAGLIGSTVRRTESGNSIPTGADVITAIDEQSVKTFEDLTSYLFTNTQVGQTVTLTVLRQGREQTVDLVLGALPSSAVQ